MSHPVLFGFLFGLFLARVLFRVRRFRRGGCARSFRDGEHRPRWFHGRHFGRRFDERDGSRDDDFRSSRNQPPPVAPRGAKAEPRIERALLALELTTRQREVLDEALLLLGESVGGDLDAWAGRDAVLAAIAAPEFDRARTEAALFHVSGGLRKELADGLEHAHDVLTSEQREKLRAQA